MNPTNPNQDFTKNKNILEKHIADILLDAYSRGEIKSDEELRDIGKQILVELEDVSNMDDMATIAKKLASQWTFFNRLALSPDDVTRLKQNDLTVQKASESSDSVS